MYKAVEGLRDSMATALSTSGDETLRSMLLDTSQQYCNSKGRQRQRDAHIMLIMWQQHHTLVSDLLWQLGLSQVSDSRIGGRMAGGGGLSGGVHHAERHAQPARGDAGSGGARPAINHGRSLARC